MIKKLFLTVFSLGVISSYSYAQESQTFISPGNIWINEAEETIKLQEAQQLRKEGGVVPQKIELSIVKHDYMEPGQFGIQMKTPETVTGCFEISPISYETKYVADLFMDVNVKSYTVKPIQTHNVSYDCGQGYKTATALMVLNIDDLKSRGTKQIRFTNGQARDNYNIIYGEGDITFQPETMIAFKTDGLLRYSMGGGNIVALQVPMAKNGDIIDAEVRALASKLALTPVTDMKAFDLEKRKNVFYYIDENGRFIDSINTQGYATAGEIPVARPYMNENGIENTPVPLKVFVTKHNHTL
ncbi:MAG: hypothetical protein AAF244_03005 [Pseudomonadota bacterium]